MEVIKYLTENIPQILECLRNYEGQARKRNITSEARPNAPRLDAEPVSAPAALVGEEPAGPEPSSVQATFNPAIDVGEAVFEVRKRKMSVYYDADTQSIFRDTARFASKGHQMIKRKKTAEKFAAAIAKIEDQGEFWGHEERIEPSRKDSYDEIVNRLES